MRQIALEHFAFVGDGDLAGADALGFQFVQRNAVLEQHHQQESVDRVAQEVWLPGLVFAHPQYAVTDVAVHSHDVGVGVVHVVVRVPPLVGRAGGVPFECPTADRRVAHPVVLAVHHIVADFHVVEDLRQSEHRGARQPGGRQNAGEQHCAPADFKGPLGFDDAADVVGIAFTEIGQHAFLDGVEFTAEVVGLLAGQGNRGLCHGFSSKSLID